MVKRYRHISHMTHEDISLFVRLLCLPPTARRYTDGLPSDQWLARQAEKISQLPKTLQRPQDWLARLSIYTNKKLNLTIEDLVPQCAVLCAAHKGLNPWIVHRVFLLISEEVTHRLDPVRKFLENPTKHAMKLKTSLGEVQDYVDRMNSMLSLWTGPDVFFRIVGDNYPPGLAMQRVENDCEACICSCIGASGQALCDLRAMMNGRSHRRRPPVLIPLVEAWIERFGEENADRLWAESTRMARDVRHIRRRLLGRKGGQRRHRTPYEKRMKELARLERDLDEQRLSASQVRAARGEIDKKLDEMFGKESRKPSGHQGKHSSSTVSASTFTASSASNASAATTRAKGTRNDRSMPVDDNSNMHQQDDADDAEQLEDYRDEFDETDAAAAYKQQDRLQGWYDAFTEIAGPSGASTVGSQHPAFRQNAAGIENSWARSQMAVSALPNPLHFSKNVTPREGDDDDDDEFVPAAGPARTQVSEWTDASVHTLATQSTHKSRRGTRAGAEAAPPMPQLSSQGQCPSRTIPSSVYSNNAPTAVHPPPAASTTAVEGSSRQPASRANTRPPRATAHYPPPSRTGSRRWLQPNTVVGSTVTAWPGPGASSEQHMARSSREFQAGLDQLDGSPGFSLPTASLTPDDSVSAVAGVYHSDHHRQEQIDADEALARRIQECDLEEQRQDGSDDDSDGDDDDDDDIRTAIANSRETARRDAERRLCAGRGGGQFSNMYMPDSSWL
ncbi:hypothetical protein INS49_006431 [Diaporthe citri]|uniref:uncharacterized protein n=1 Tax=Diaporthe citri TaxID=83186 RepID=UPI001C823E46|nr:uncharacterized protein INS49_006431 [Diaporthe citri]KAG6364827.1 hypothetical protein INS49_006431 [Diaporthe citri]